MYCLLSSITTLQTIINTHYSKNTLYLDQSDDTQQAVQTMLVYTQP